MFDTCRQLVLQVASYFYIWFNENKTQKAKINAANSPENQMVLN